MALEIIKWISIDFVLKSWNKKRLITIDSCWFKKIVFFRFFSFRIKIQAECTSPIGRLLLTTTSTWTVWLGWLIFWRHVDQWKGPLMLWTILLPGDVAVCFKYSAGLETRLENNLMWFFWVHTCTSWLGSASHSASANVVKCRQRGSLHGSL